MNPRPKPPEDWAGPSLRKFLDRFVSVAARGEIRARPEPKPKEDPDEVEIVGYSGNYLYRTKERRP